MTHRHLSQEERYQIEQLAVQLTVEQIANRLGRHRSTIYRELKRSTGRYEASRAQIDRKRCAARSNANAPRHCKAVWSWVRSRLHRQWSPQQIAGRARLVGQTCASWQAIYGWIRRCWPQRHQRPLRRAWRRASGFAWARRARPIAKRPAAVQRRDQLGHWETDTMIGIKGARKAQLLVSVERASRYSRLSLLDDAMPWTVARTLNADLLSSTAWPVRTLTVDRGIEFCQLPQLLINRLFVCDPQRPNQRGTNENTIGLVRQYLPKGQPLSTQSRRSIAKIERLLNDRPRACLGFKTPREVLFA